MEKTGKVDPMMSVEKAREYYDILVCVDYTEYMGEKVAVLKLIDDLDSGAYWYINANDWAGILCEESVGY